ncbi:MAG: cation:proton antiporter family protein [Fimbriimonadaceae bacterium]
MFESGFHEIAAIVAVSAGIGAVAILLRQPLIVAFIGSGILVGPTVFGWVSPSSALDLLSKIGISLLLFVVGLKLDVKLVRNMGSVATAAGVGQVLFTVLFGFGIARALGYPLIESLYIAIALTFSSTIIIVKLLSDKREIDSLHGRISIGILIVQDLLVVLLMIALSSFSEAERGTNFVRDISMIAFKGAAFIFLTVIVTKVVLPSVLRWAARTQELLLVFAISWALGLAAMGDFLGFSKEVGAFVAGITLASTPFREAIAARLVSLRDFLLLFFFINLGASLELDQLKADLGPALVFSAFVLIGNPLIVMAIMGVMGYRKRTGFLTGLTVAQVSEFSLLLAQLGVALGHIGGSALSLITLVALVTIALSTYLILYSVPIYDRIGRYFSIFERRGRLREEETGDSGFDADVIVVGLGRFGNNIAAEIRALGTPVLGVDFDPEPVRAWRSRGLQARYGDIEDPELLRTLPLQSAKWVVSTLPHPSLNKFLVQVLRQNAFNGRIAVTAHNEFDAAEMRDAKPDLIFMPFIDAAREAANTLVKGMKKRIV